MQPPEFNRAIDGVKELMRAELRSIGVEIRGLRERFEEVASVRHDVDQIRIERAEDATRIMALEAFQSAQEKRLGESRAYRRIHVPTFLFSGVGSLVATAAFLVAVF